MPVKIEKVKGKKCYRVSTPSRVLAKCTTKKKAEAQRRLVNAAENNPSFREKLKKNVMRT